jgi:hypothetical protein
VARPAALLYARHSREDNRRDSLIEKDAGQILGLSEWRYGAEVDELREPVLREPDIARAHITMNQATSVNEGQR